MKVITFKLAKKNATFSLVFALVFINQITTKAEEIHFKEKESKINFELSIPLQPSDDFQRSHQEDSLEVAEYSIRRHFYRKFLTLLKLLILMPNGVCVCVGGVIVPALFQTAISQWKKGFGGPKFRDFS